MTLLERVSDTPTASISLLERELELEAIEAALASARAGEGKTIVIEGEAGIGKSTLVAYVLDAARRRGLRVLHAQGRELEHDVPFGVAVDLFGSIARAPDLGIDPFSGPARVTAGLLGSQPHGDPIGVDAADATALRHGLFWLVLNLVERDPLVLVIDDAQWADESTLRFLHRLVQRAEELPVLLVVALRPIGDASTRGRGAELLRASSAVVHLAPEPLTEDGVGELLGRLSGREVEADLRRACWLATGGNPFFVTEVTHELARGAFIDDADVVASLLPGRVGRFIESRLAGLDLTARRLAEAASILGDAATLRRAQLLGGIDPTLAVDAARRLVEASILEDSPAFTFRHPIVRSGVYASIPGPARASFHREAALLLADEGVEIGEIGGQLREAEPTGDRRIVELLRAAATAATRRGDAGVATALMRRALEEPPTANQRAEVLAALAAAEAATGAPDALETYRQAMAVTDDVFRRASLYLEMGHAMISGGQWVAAREAFEQGLAELGESQLDLREALEAGFLSSAWVTMSSRTEIEDRVQRILRSPKLGPASRELATWVAFQQGATIGSTASEMAALVKRAFAEAPVSVLVTERQLVEVGAGLLLETDELVFEVDFLTRALEAARQSGPSAKVGIYAYCRAWPNYYMGNLADAIADADEARRSAELGWEAFLPAAVTVMAEAHLERGEIDAAEAALAIDVDALGPRIDAAMLLPIAVGRVALARGDVAAAVEHFQRARDTTAAIRMRNTIPTDWRAWLSVSLVAADRRDEARTVAREGVEIARSWGAEWPLGSALRVAGVVEGGAGGIAELREAEELLRDSPARLERARLLVDLGAALRRHGSLTEARGVLSRAADLARELGARALLDRAAAELRAAGARPRRYALSGVESLTPAELRVAREAGAGRTNREIAQALFVTPKAVEFHLANVFRKLEIGTRHDLPRAMPSPG
jgi:DNA-binding CsgD family transcriptional regulator